MKKSFSIQINTDERYTQCISCGREDPSIEFNYVSSSVQEVSYCPYCEGVDEDAEEDAENEAQDNLTLDNVECTHCGDRGADINEIVIVGKRQQEIHLKLADGEHMSSIYVDKHGYINFNEERDIVVGAYTANDALICDSDTEIEDGILASTIGIDIKSFAYKIPIINKLSHFGDCTHWYLTYDNSDDKWDMQYELGYDYYIGAVYVSEEDAKTLVYYLNTNSVGLDKWYSMVESCNLTFDECDMEV